MWVGLCGTGKFAERFWKVVECISHVAVPNSLRILTIVILFV